MTTPLQTIQDLRKRILKDGKDSVTDKELSAALEALRQSRESAVAGSTKAKAKKAPTLPTDLNDLFAPKEPK